MKEIELTIGNPNTDVALYYPNGENISMSVTEILLRYTREEICVYSAIFSTSYKWNEAYRVSTEMMR